PTPPFWLNTTRRMWPPPCRYDRASSLCQATGPGESDEGSRPATTSRRAETKKPATRAGFSTDRRSDVEDVVHRLEREVLRVGQGSHAALDGRLGHRVGDHGDQARVHRLGNDVLAAELQTADAVGLADLLGDRQLGQVAQRQGGGDLHLLVDAGGANVQGAAEDEGEAQHVVDLVRVVRTA